MRKIWEFFWTLLGWIILVIKVTFIFVFTIFDVIKVVVATIFEIIFIFIIFIREFKFNHWYDRLKFELRTCCFEIKRMFTN